ncbi:MAG: hypothetical protein ACJAU8_000399, partial [Candidatus Paceibacteria bacterium]
DTFKIKYFSTSRQESKGGVLFDQAKTYTEE